MFPLSSPQDDGLLIQEVGWWSRDKHHFLARYIDAFTTAMKDKRWSGLHYVDLFAGAGIERIEGSGQLGWGSPLIAAQAPHSFHALHLCERSRAKHAALKARLCRLRAGRPDQIIQGDANKKIADVVRAIPRDALALAFLDAYGLHCDFATLQTLSERQTDLVIFFPVELDAIRNWKYYYWDNPESNLDGVLGPGADWRQVVSSTTPDQIPQKLVQLYTDQIRTLGYGYFDWEPIPNTGRPLYRLVFCSKSEVGLRIWHRISSIKPGGQRTMFGD